MSSSVVRVLHLLARDDWGGTEVQVFELTRRAVACEHVVAIIDPSGPLHELLARHAVGTRLLGGRGGSVAAAWRLRAVLRSESWDVIEAYGFRAGLVARLGAPSPGVACPC